jgi:SAM-dependent methyltransferase
MTNERCYHGSIERLRSPERLSVLDVPRVLDYCLEGLHAASVLDVGTGSGAFAEAFAGRGLQAAGVDVNPEMVEAARRFMPQARFEIAPAEALPFPADSFDLVFLGLVLHEAGDALQALREARRVARLRVAILEWPYDASEHGPPLEHRLRPDQIEDLSRQAGFARLESVRLTHVVVYRMACASEGSPAHRGGSGSSGASDVAA